MEYSSIRNHYADAIINECVWWNAFAELMTRAEVDVDREMVVVDLIEDPDVQLPNAEWVAAYYEYADEVYHNGKRLIRIEHDTEKGGWGMTAIFADGREVNVSSYEGETDEY